MCNEATAKSFATRTGASIYAIRIGNVIEPHEYRQLPGVLRQSGEGRKRIAWSYIDARDLGQLVLKAIETDGLGIQIFNATNDTDDAERCRRTEFLARNYRRRRLSRESSASTRRRSPTGKIARSAGLQGSARLADIRAGG